MSNILQLAELDVQVERKRIKNVHLSVLPPDGTVRVSAPERLSDHVLRSFVLSRLDWIRRQQEILECQPREPKREFLQLESHYVWGSRYLLELQANCPCNEVVLRPGVLTIKHWGRYSQTACDRILQDWYRFQVRGKASELLATWTKRIGVGPDRFFVQRMKTKWGSCNSEGRTVRLNSELGKKPVECLEFILVHELIHLIEPTHNERFVRLMNRHLPAWKARRDLLNSQPLSHQEWAY